MTTRAKMATASAMPRSLVHFECRMRFSSVTVSGDGRLRPKRIAQGHARRDHETVHPGVPAGRAGHLVAHRAHGDLDATNVVGYGRRGVRGVLEPKDEP